VTDTPETDKAVLKFCSSNEGQMPQPIKRLIGKMRELERRAVQAEKDRQEAHWHSSLLRTQIRVCDVAFNGLMSEMIQLKGQP